ncbi:hypothetical protein FY557_07750 [Chryseobacterium sp. SN22]|uniref:hypothetical protein n=1 Tax=Chryseobacterium sp. SN22 TaxID=2606431 RepID=UPI0011EC77B1|nr:hypothetical protein [Chryseobacterium sp. SN22]KAA0128762.1 hypothetical protein FY557_07750 [Chryseobacterium sp. SN22]
MAAFAVAGTMSANTIAETENLPEEQQAPTEAKAYGCVDVTLSCGVTGVACGETVGDIIDVVLAADDAYCGN